MRTYISLALLLTVLAVCHAKKLLVETEDEDMGHPPIIEEPSILTDLFNYGGESPETLEWSMEDDAKPKRRMNKSNKRLGFEQLKVRKRG